MPIDLGFLLTCYSSSYNKQNALGDDLALLRYVPVNPAVTTP